MAFPSVRSNLYDRTMFAAQKPFWISMQILMCSFQCQWQFQTKFISLPFVPWGQTSLQCNNGQNWLILWISKTIIMQPLIISRFKIRSCQLQFIKLKKNLSNFLKSRTQGQHPNFLYALTLFLNRILWIFMSFNSVCCNFRISQYLNLRKKTS